MKLFCPILGRETSTEPTPYKRDQWKVVRCLETGFYFLENPPEYEMLESEFEWSKSFCLEQKRRQTNEPIFSRISKESRRVRNILRSRHSNKFYTFAKQALAHSNHEQPCLILDVGCGGGRLVKQLHDRLLLDGITTVPLGIEISNPLAEVAGKVLRSLGGDVIHASAIEGAAQCSPGSFDVVVMRSFLEHERRPLELLHNLRQALKQDGVIIIKVPNFACWNRVLRGSKWCGFRYPDHVNYFTPETMRILAKEAGYSMESGLLDRFPLSDSMYAVLRPLRT
jgi:2-polyprenyl-3-methyl-5-hydroxy-6-metoxy-1,4-benzoquinol methylase